MLKVIEKERKIEDLEMLGGTMISEKGRLCLLYVFFTFYIFFPFFISKTSPAHLAPPTLNLFSKCQFLKFWSLAQSTRHRHLWGDVN